MAQPNVSSVSIGSDQFRAVGIHFGVSTLNRGFPGTPLMGSIACTVLVMVDLNDQVNMPFTFLRTIFELSYGVSREKIQDIELLFWSDDAAQDAICTYKFRGWISNYTTTTGFGNKEASSGGNHILTLTLQPELDVTNFVKIAIGN